MTTRVPSTTMNHSYKTRLQTECVVPEVLSFILFLSRIAGIAPLKFKKTRDGWCVRVSRLYCVHSYILLIAFIILVLVYYVGKGDEIEEDRASWGGYSDVMRVLGWICQIVFIIVSCIIYHTSYKRMCCMIDCISQLTIINKKMNYYFTSLATNKASLWIFVIMSLIFGYLAVFLDYGFYLYDIILADKVGFVSSSILSTYLFSLTMHLYAIKFALVVMLVVSTLQRVNNSLKVILYEIRNQSFVSDLSSVSKYSPVTDVLIEKYNETDIVDIIPRYVSCVIDLVPVIGVGGSSNPDKIRYLAIIYCALCDIVRQLNISEGSTLLATLLFSFTFMITTPYFMFNVLFTSGSEIPTAKCVLIFIYFVFSTTILATAVEPCHRTHQQLLLTENLINNLLRHTDSEAALKYQLKLFKLHIMLNPVSYSPCQFLKFNRNTLVAAVSTVITNITVMMHL